MTFSGEGGEVLAAQRKAVATTLSADKGDTVEKAHDTATSGRTKRGRTPALRNQRYPSFERFFMVRKTFRTDRIESSRE